MFNRNHDTRKVIQIVRKRVYHKENGQAFCWPQIRKQVSFPLLQSKIPSISQGFDV
jgi:tRNA U38,U39,U40 pseudouridine synthase TruA